LSLIVRDVTIAALRARIVAEVAAVVVDELRYRAVRVHVLLL